MPKRKIKVGDIVTCRVPQQAYYSGYAGRPDCSFEPGDLGIVVNVEVPYVRGPEKTFSRVEFFKKGTLPDVLLGHLKDYTTECPHSPWSVALDNDNIVFVADNWDKAIALNPQVYTRSLLYRIARANGFYSFRGSGTLKGKYFAGISVRRVSHVFTSRQKQKDYLMKVGFSLISFERDLMVGVKEVDRVNWFYVGDTTRKI